MTFTKNKLAAAMAGAFIAGVGSQAAFGAVDLDSTANAGVSLASETIIGTAGVNLSAAGDTFDVTATMNANAIPDNTDIRVAVTLSGGTFTAAPALTLAAGTACSTGVTPAFTIFTGGGTTDSTVTFNSNAGAADVTAGCTFTFAPDGITVLDQSAVTFTYDVSIADNFGPTELGGDSGPYVSFGPVVSLSADSTGADATAQIDVAADSTMFTGATSSTAVNIGGWQVDENTTARLDTAGNTVQVDDVVGNAQATITAANGFDAFSGTSGGAIACLAGGGAFSTADSTIATCDGYAPAAGGDAAGSNAVTLWVNGGTANTTQIAETSITATIAATSAATATYDASGATGTVSLLSLARNGSSASLNFALTPGGSYPMFIRITNPSAVSGPVTLSLTNDDGDSSGSFDLGDVAGVDSSELAAGASTGLLSIDDVFAAAQAANEDFDLGATNKLRVGATAEFGDAGAGTEVIMGAFSVSSDGTTFNMMTDASD